MPSPDITYAASVRDVFEQGAGSMIASERKLFNQSEDTSTLFKNYGQLWLINIKPHQCTLLQRARARKQAKSVSMPSTVTVQLCLRNPR